MLRSGTSGVITDGACNLAVGAVIGQYAFEECAKLAQLSLPQVRAMMDSAALAPHKQKSGREVSMPVAFRKWS